MTIRSFHSPSFTIVRRYISLAVIAALSAALFSGTRATAASDNKDKSTASTSQASSNSPTTSPANSSTTRPASWRFPDEQTWLVDSVCRDIVEILLYAKYHAEDPARLSPEKLACRTIAVDKMKGQYKLECPVSDPDKPLLVEINLSDYAWSPADYAHLAKQVIAALSLKPSAPSIPPKDFLKRLSDAGMDGLFMENERISKDLSANPLDAGLHEQAALLQAVFDMLECARGFSDTRPPLSRIAAHLAIAKALSSETKPNIINQIADIALESMSCRDGVAVKKIVAIEKDQTDPLVQSLLKAIKIRSTGDYRLFQEEHSTPLEATQYGLRLSFHFNSDAIVDYVQQHKPQPEICWRRIGLMGLWTVGSGHVFAANAMTAELDDFYQDYHYYKKKILTDMNELAAGLNKVPTRCLAVEDGSPRLVALSWDDVAAFHARHVLSAMNAEYYFYQTYWGVPERAKKLLNQAESLLAPVTLFPMALHRVVLDETQKKSFLSAAQKVLDEHPELLTYTTWRQATDKIHELKPDASPPAPEFWFSPLVPVGTAYYFLARYDLHKHPEIDMNLLTHMRELCPYDFGLCHAWTVKKYGQRPTAAQLEEGYGPLLQFDVELMESVANADYGAPDKYIAREEKIAQLAPCHYLKLGDYCAMHGQPAKAAAYFEKGVKLCQDDVAVANDSDWLINYWYDHEQRSKAMALARHAGEVYSRRGLIALGHLYERFDKLDYAASTYRDIKDRYNTDDDLKSFYLRHPKLSGPEADSAVQYRRKVFPDGMKPAALAGLKGPPKTGAIITRSYLNSDAAGLRNGQIIVGLNGYAVSNRAQYMLLKDLQPAGNFLFKFIVWNGKTYQELVKTKLFTFELEDYKPAQKK